MVVTPKEGQVIKMEGDNCKTPPKVSIAVRFLTGIVKDGC